MSGLLPEYDACPETRMHYRCTICSGWWSIDDGSDQRPCWCPHCGQQLNPPQYPEDRKPRPKTPEILDL